MKPTHPFSEHSLYQRLTVLGAFLALIAAAVLYIATAVSIPLIAALAGINLLCGACGLLWGEQKKWLRILVRILLLAVPALLTLFIGFYLILVASSGYTVSLTESCVLLTMLTGTAVLFASPVFALLALRERRLDVILCRIFAVTGFVLAVFTVACTVRLTGDNGTFLLVTLLRSELFNGIFLVCAFIPALMSFDSILSRIDQKRAAKRMAANEK